MTKLVYISKNFTKDEFERSSVAARHGIDNSIPDHIMPNVKRLVNEVLQPVRDKLGKNLLITSGYRNETVNALVGGVKNSSHTKGLAADLVVPGFITLDMVRLIVKCGVPFDQVIEEFGQWVHVSIAEEGKNPRGQILKAYKKPGEAVVYKSLML